jgi:hypothetical protein
MGHKINPETFRLGTSIDWKFQVKDDLLANITIYKTVKKMFMEYSAPYVSSTIRRSTNPRIIEEKKKKNILIKNPFISHSIIFSHINVSYLNHLKIYIFLFDENAEKKRITKNIFEKPFYYLTGKFFSKDVRHDIFFKKEIYFPFKFSKYFISKDRKWRTYLTIYKNKRQRKWKKKQIKLSSSFQNLKLTKKKVIKKIYKMFKNKIFKGNKQKNKNFIGGIWLLNFENGIIFNNQKILDLKKTLKILKVVLRLYQNYEIKDLKKKVFFLNLLLVMLEKINSLLQNKILKYRLRLIQILLNIILSTMQYKLLSNDLHTKLKMSRFLIFNLYSKILTFSINKICFITNKNKLTVAYYGMANKHVSASLLLNMLIIQLGDYVNYKNIIKNITKRLQKLRHIEGFRIILSGRLTRKERAAYIIKNHKSIPLSTYNALIDYAGGFKIMKFGCVGIKIYLKVNKITTPPYWYIFKFQNILKI